MGNAVSMRRLKFRGIQSADASQTAHPTHNQIDLHSRLAGEVELLDHWPVDEAVHFRNDSRWLSRPRLLDLVPNEA